MASSMWDSLHICRWAVCIPPSPDCMIEHREKHHLYLEYMGKHNLYLCNSLSVDQQVSKLMRQGSSFKEGV